jgi:hypothetical protein
MELNGVRNKQSSLWAQREHVPVHGVRDPADGAHHLLPQEQLARFLSLFCWKNSYFSVRVGGGGGGSGGLLCCYGGKRRKKRGNVKSCH